MAIPGVVTPTSHSQLVRLPVVVSMTGLSKSEIYRRIALGVFPRPTKLGYRTSAWSADEVSRWVGARIAERDAKATTQ